MARRQAEHAMPRNLHSRMARCVRAQDDNEVIPELEEPNDREVASDEGMDDQEWEDDENEPADEDEQKVKDGTGF